MSDSPALSVLTLPPDLNADDLLGLHDQLHARVAAVQKPKGHKRAKTEVTLPKGVVRLDALPPHIGLPWKRFAAAAADLEQFRAARASAQADATLAASDQSEKDAANADADDRWRAFEQWNGGAALLAEDGATPSPAEARWLYAQLFPKSQGLRFITRRPRIQWNAMLPRMKVLEGDRAKAVVSGFGGTRHFQQLVAAHARFGKAYGYTTVVEEAAGPTDGRSQWLTAREALRTLIQKIESYADPDIKGSEPLVTFLLAPYVEMAVDLEKSRRPARAKKPAPTPPTPP